WSNSRLPPSSERCRMRRLCAVVLALSLASAWSLRAAVPVPEPRPLALVGGLIRTQTDAGDFVGTIVVRDGKIVALGPDLAVPARGVTAVYVQPTGSGLLSGSGAVVRVGPGVTADDVSVKSPAGVQAALGATPPPPPATDDEPVGRGRRGGGGRGGAQPAAAP